MQKKGFTLIEMMVAIAIVAILASMIGQNFYKSQTVQRFDSEARRVFFGILDARTNAISEKKCTNGSMETWNTVINLSGFTLNCGVIAENTVNFSGITGFDSLKFPPASDPQVNVKLEFLPESAQLRITDDNDVSKQKVKITLKHSSLPNEKRTICIDRVAGFPTFNTGENCLE